MPCQFFFLQETKPIDATCSLNGFSFGCLSDNLHRASSVLENLLKVYEECKM